LSSRAKPRDLQCAFRTSQIFLPNPNPKQKCHPACPGLPWNRSEAQWRDLQFPSATNQSSLRAPLSPLSSRAKPRDLQFNQPLMEMFFNHSPSHPPHHQPFQRPANLLNSLTPQIIKERQSNSPLCFGLSNRQIPQVPPPRITRL
jgi:hypothetical protein